MKDTTLHYLFTKYIANSNYANKKLCFEIADKLSVIATKYIKEKYNP